MIELRINNFYEGNLLTDFDDVNVYIENLESSNLEVTPGNIRNVSCGISYHHNPIRTEHYIEGYLTNLGLFLDVYN